MLVLYSSTLFLSSALLFSLQPMYAKMVLPILGGTPAVWNTCILFFQAALLAGYVYSHAVIKCLGVGRQSALHLVLLLLPFLSLPIALPKGWVPPAEQNPIPWLLLLLATSIGLPFFVLSTSAPMLQKWFANTNHPSAKDPYFLYSASNAGSMLALLGYPVLIEPFLRLKDQSYAWAIGYGVFVLLTMACAATLRHASRTRLQGPSMRTPDSLKESQSDTSSSLRLTSRTRIQWVLLSFIPSSLLLGLTTHVTTNITPVPLFWVIPLALYLLTFVLVFGRNPIVPHGLMIRALPFVVLSLVLSLCLNMLGPLWLLITLHVLTFFVIAMVCHGEVAKSRPPTRYLTQFYLYISIGGVIGGLFNALIAPVIFDKALEYPMALILACLIQRQTEAPATKRLTVLLDLALPAALAVLVFGLIPAVKFMNIQAGLTKLAIMVGIPIVLCFSFRARPVRFGLGIAALLLASAYSLEQNDRILKTERSFFGIYRVISNDHDGYHSFVHGNVVHGKQSMELTRSNEPLLYYYPTGPIGQLFSSSSVTHSAPRVAIIGLGTGAIACYGEPGQEFTFYEIDPIVERIARDGRYFTYLRDCPPKINVILGDARLSLKKAPDHHYGLIIFDAFTSDAIPVHLLTHEALKLYLSKLEEGGILAFHTSNLYLDLKPVLGNLAAELGLTSLIQDDLKISEAEKNKGKAPSQWVLMARTKHRFTKLAHDLRWNPLPPRPGAPMWTDNFSNILSVIRWN